MARARGANALMSLAFEAIYGTPPTTGYSKMPFTRSNLGETQGLLGNDLLGYGREPLAPVRDVIDNEGDITVGVDLRNFGSWLKLMLGNPTTTGTGTLTHVFSSGAVTLPSATIEVGLPEVPSYGQNYGVRGNTMRIGMQRSGLLTATIGLIGQGENHLAATGAGTPTERVVERFSAFQGAVTRAGAPLASVTAAEFMLSNNLDKVETLRGDGRIEDADAGMTSMTGSITTRFADATLLNQAIAGTPIAMTFGWTISASKSLIIAVPAVYLPKPKRAVEGAGGISATFEWQAARDATGKTFTATLVNDVATY